MIVATPKFGPLDSVKFKAWIVSNFKINLPGSFGDSAIKTTGNDLPHDHSSWFSLRKLHKSVGGEDLKKAANKIRQEPTSSFFFVENKNIIVGTESRIERFMISFMSSAFSRGEVYSQKEKENVIRSVKAAKVYDKYQKIWKFDWPKPRDLMFGDLVYGGVVGSKVKYRVAYKSDGVRIAIYIGNFGAWAIGKNYFKLIARTTARNKKFKERVKIMLIFDCELVGDEIFILDCMRKWKNSNDKKDLITKKNHDERLRTYRELPRRITSEFERLKIKVKKFYNVFTVKSFFDTNSNLLQNSLEVKNDGLIFVPLNHPYHPVMANGNRTTKSGKIPRILTQMPDICKWKPSDKLTVDFLWNPKDKSLKTSTGDSFFADKKKIGFENIPKGIVETLPGTDNIKFIGERKDKDKPNSTYVITRGVLKLLRDPITAETMSGDNIRLMRKYHLKIKRDLFSKAHGRRLLDIGSGKGADISSWMKYKVVYAVEPNKDNIEIMKRRISNYENIGFDGSFPTKVVIINAGGEESNKIKEIVKIPCDVISIMLSMTFFWESAEMLDGLVSTLVKNSDRNSLIIFMTMNKFEKDMETKSYSLKLVESFDAQKNFANKIKINFTHSNAIVQNQIEWLVDLEQLHQRLSNYGFKFKVEEIADKELLLSESGSNLSKQYSFGYFKYSPEFERFYFRLNSLEDVRAYTTKSRNEAILILNNEDYKKEPSGEKLEKFGEMLESGEYSVSGNIKFINSLEGDKMPKVAKGHFYVTTDGMIVGRITAGLFKKI